jgi:hypothetical protein
VSRAAVGAAVILGVGGCRRACKDDHPYVPYTVGEADAAAPEASVPEAAASAAPSGASTEPSLVAPRNTTRWSVEGVDLVAPEGRELLLGIVRDFDGDGLTDALVVAQPAAPPEEQARETITYELLHYRHGRPPATLATAPPARTGDGCSPVVRLERVGARSAFAELGAACTRGATGRSVFVVRLAAEPAIAFDARIEDPPAAPELAIAVDGADRDGDGIDDVGLRFTIEGGGPPFEPGPRLSAKLAFFDRSAGPSRDPDEPDASLRAIAQQATSRAKNAKGKDSATVPPLVQQMRQLYRAMCEEGGAPRLVKARGGGAVRCGTSKPLEDAGVAELRALVTQGDALRAFALADTVQAPPASKTAARTTEIQTLLGQVASPVDAKDARVVGTSVDSAKARHPEWGPLAFESSGQLLVRSGQRVTRVDLESATEEPVDMAAWSSQVLSPDGKSRWLEAYHACEGVALRATFAPTGGDGDVRDALLPIAPRLGARCTGTRGDQATTLPIAWGPRGLEAIVAGQPLLIPSEGTSASALLVPLDQMPPLGSPRSPSARALAVPTSRGILVRTTRWSLYRSPVLEPYAEIRHCAVSDDASRLACVRRGRVVIATFDR